MNSLQEWLEHIKNSINTNFLFMLKIQKVWMREWITMEERWYSTLLFSWFSFPTLLGVAPVWGIPRKACRNVEGCDADTVGLFFFHQSWISICMAGTQRAREGELVREKKFIWPCSGSDLQAYQKDALKKATRTVCKVPASVSELSLNICDLTNLDYNL